MTFADYADFGQVSVLMESVGMPRETQDCVLESLSDGLVVPDEVFAGLFALDTGRVSSNWLSENLTGQNGMQCLAVLLCAALRTREIYRLHGIGEIVYLDTMKAFSRFVDEYMVSFGANGFDRTFWVYHALSASLFRLGALEFEMTKARKTVPGYFVEGDPVLSVHIPSDAVLTRENLDSAYDQAKVFFPEYFPTFQPKLTYCSTWLLAPALEALLPPDSRIRNFRSDYQVVESNPEDKGYRVWLYKNRSYADVESLPENTFLQRSVKAFLLSGGTVGGGVGVLRSGSAGAF